MQDELAQLQSWYEGQCDGDWEHEFGISIGTLDNPGWTLDVDLADTDLASRPFNPVEDLAPKHDWIRCWVEDEQFHAVGGPQMLRRMIRTFLDWAKAEAAN